MKTKFGICTVFVFCLFLVILQTSLVSGQQDVKSIELYHGFFPELYVLSMDKAFMEESSKQLFINDHLVDPLDSSLIVPMSDNAKYILLIDHSTNYSDRSALGKKNHFLLELADYLIPHDKLLFSLIYNDNIQQFDLTRDNVLSLDEGLSKKARLTDALILCKQQIKSKYAHEEVMIVVIGSGQNLGNMEKSFLPTCPILYFLPQDHFFRDSFLTFMIQASGGDIRPVPENIDLPAMVQLPIRENLISNRMICHIYLPWHMLRYVNSLKLKSTQSESLVNFPLPASYRFIIFTIWLAFFSLLLLLALYFRRKRKQKIKKARLCHEYSTAFLIISYRDHRTEKRISSCEYIIGNSPVCDCSIEDFDLSSSHCMIKENNGSHVIIDLKSRNGVYVNGKKIQRCLLNNEDVIGIGSTCIIYKKGPISYVSEKKIL